MLHTQTRKISVCFLTSVTFMLRLPCHAIVIKIKYLFWIKTCLLFYVYLEIHAVLFDVSSQDMSDRQVPSHAKHTNIQG